MNRFYGVGRIASKPVLRYTTNNIAYTMLTIALKRDKEKVDFIDVQFWNSFAENINKYMDKGCLVSFEAMYEKNRYEKDGQAFYNIKFIGKSIEFLTFPKKENIQIQQDIFTSKEEEIEKAEDPFEDFARAVEIKEEDLPF